MIIISGYSVDSGPIDDLNGIYHSVNNKFERASVLILKSDSTFIYKYAVGGCQAEITGRWNQKEKMIEMTNDPEFFNSDSIIYPDMSRENWMIKKKGLKPTGPIDSGCLVEAGLHKKVK